MKKMKVLTVNGQSYGICDPDAARIDDGAVSTDKTWSSQKLDSLLGNVEEALDGIISLQKELIGGEVV